jgi:hypothetical protein
MEELPRGNVRHFAGLLFDLYREARRPTLSQISRDINTGEFKITASSETVRRMLLGKTVPAQWPLIDAMIKVLSTRADVDPEISRGYFEGEEIPSRTEAIAQAWHAVLDEDSYDDGRPVEAPVTREVGFADDPWMADDPRSNSATN